MNNRIAFATVLAVALSACGGGGGSSPNQQLNGQVITEAGLYHPVVTSVTPATATLGVLTTFTVNGTQLGGKMSFALDNCVGVTDLGVRTATQEQFSCTPSGSAGAHEGKVTPIEIVPTSTFTFQVNYQ